ncbi:MULTISPECIES: PadR family transcriptional regulator [Exiguobacterium]|uniref:PadR family transcriptional regulator n=1 Tax=Exiguobacterium TaxID=33986 RepID=UPI001BE98EF9|nr:MULTISPECIES: PadR family transcriptional regulator [Exiguobacterium]MCT4782112.1 PadR family transcriptional regulator [Exiguobacterium himgiriensis]
MEIDKELLKGHIDTMILSLLEDCDMYGYEIAKVVHTRTDEAFELKEGTLYLSLKRLEKKGSVESYWGDEQGAGGRRKYYRVTAEGLAALERKKVEWRLVKQLMDLFLHEEGDSFETLG